MKTTVALATAVLTLPLLSACNTGPDTASGQILNASPVAYEGEFGEFAYDFDWIKQCAGYAPIQVSGAIAEGSEGDQSPEAAVKRSLAADIGDEKAAGAELTVVAGAENTADDNFHVQVDVTDAKGDIVASYGVLSIGKGGTWISDSYTYCSDQLMPSAEASDK